MKKQPITMEMVRAAIKSLGAKGAEVSNAQLYDVLGLNLEADKVRLRGRIQDMVARGEVLRVSEGIFTYDFRQEKKDFKALEKLWRFVRKQKPCWTMKDASLLTGVSYSYVTIYFSWLESEGYICSDKRKGHAKLYKATLKADQSPETPYMPASRADPFEKERAAAAKIVRMMLCEDPRLAKTAKGIADACSILLARFGNVKQVENETAGGLENV